MKEKVVRRMEIHPEGTENVFGALPWVATLKSTIKCDATTLKGHPCARKVKYLYVDLAGHIHMVCLSHLHSVLERDDEQTRLAGWMKEVRYVAKAGKVCNDHNPVQHRDGKPPWCRNCHLTANGEVPISKIKLEEKQ